MKAEHVATAGDLAVDQSIEIPALGRSRILSAKQTAELCDVSLTHFRRLYRTGKIPPGIKIGARKLGWPAGVMIDFLASKSEAA